MCDVDTRCPRIDMFRRVARVLFIETAHAQLIDYATTEPYL